MYSYYIIVQLKEKEFEVISLPDVGHHMLFFFYSFTKIEKEFQEKINKNYDRVDILFKMVFVFLNIGDSLLSTRKHCLLDCSSKLSTPQLRVTHFPSDSTVSSRAFPFLTFYNLTLAISPTECLISTSPQTISSLKSHLTLKNVASCSVAQPRLKLFLCKQYFLCIPVL
jgi:hypothetical protein